MPHLTLEERVTALEQQVAELRAQQANGAKKKPWLETAGIFTGDEGMMELFDDAMKLREEDRRKARRRSARIPSTRRPKK
jgi:hypothetical protein